MRDEVSRMSKKALEREVRQQRQQMALIQVQCEHERDLGWQEYAHMMEEFIHPINEMLGQVNAAMNVMRGAALGGAGKLQRETIHRMSGEVVRFLKLADQRIQYAAEHITPDPTPYFNVAPALEMLKAADHFYATGDIQPLCILSGENNAVLNHLVSLRPKLRPGAPKKVVTDHEWLFTEAKQLKDANGGSWPAIAELLISRRDSEAYTDVQRQQIKVLANDPGGAAKYLRQGWSGLKRRSVGISLFRHPDG